MNRITRTTYPSQLTEHLPTWKPSKWHIVRPLPLVIALLVSTSTLAEGLQELFYPSDEARNSICQAFLDSDNDESALVHVLADNMDRGFQEHSVQVISELGLVAQNCRFARGRSGLSLPYDMWQGFIVTISTRGIRDLAFVVEYAVALEFLDDRGELVTRFEHDPWSSGVLSYHNWTPELDGTWSGGSSFSFDDESPAFRQAVTSSDRVRVIWKASDGINSAVLPKGFGNCEGDRLAACLAGEWEE